MILENKNILITGAGKGIGFSLAKIALNEGAFVYALIKSSKDKKKFEKLKNIKVYIGNTLNKKIIKKIFNDSIKQKKYITGLVNNAGIRQRISFNKITKSGIQNVFENNFFSILFLMQEFSSFLIKKKLKGSIVNIGSIVGQNGFSELAGYASTKGALTSMTKSFAVEMAEKNIRANIVSPGFTKTSYFEKFKKNKKLYNWTLSRTPMKRWGEPEEISNLICFLLSENSSFITGENINIDGGWLS